MVNRTVVMFRLGLHILYISVSLYTADNGSWGRSPCSDPAAIDYVYRTWCRDYHYFPHDGIHSFGFA